MRNIRYAMGMIILASVLFTSVLVWFIGTANSRYTQVNMHWTEYSQRESKVIESILFLKSHLGYGGFIHSFKNYVLRGEEKYFIQVSQHYHAVMDSLKTLKVYVKTSAEQQALLQVERTLNQYWSNVLIAQKALAEGKMPHQVDQLVKVDDSPALKAIVVIEKAISARALGVQQNTNTAIHSASKFLQAGLLLVVPVLLLSVLLLHFIRKVHASNQETLKARQWLDTVLDTAPDATLCVNNQGQIIRSNQMTEQLLGYRQQELNQMTVEQLIPMVNAEKHIGYREAFFQPPTSRVMGQGQALFARLKDGQQRMVEISLSHTGEGKDAIAIATIRDVTEREEQRKQLLEAKDQAEQALVQLEMAKDSLVESEKLAALGELVAGVAHEINTPIGNALSSATFLHDKTVQIAELYDQEELSEEELETYFTRSNDAASLIEINLGKAADLINSFKHIAVDQVGEEHRCFNLHTYLREVLLSLKPLYKKTNIEVSYRCEENIELDTYPGALSQCLTNLITNAVVHGFDQGQEGRIDICVISSDVDKIKIAIADNGKGIPRTLHKKIFEPFFTTKRNAGGSGLGLQIVHNLITHNLGGNIQLESQEGEGTTFWLELPLSYQLSASATEQ